MYCQLYGLINTKGSQGNLKSFCISSKAYQKLCGRNKRDPPVHGFTNLEQTNIPQLREFAHRSTFADRERIADSILTELSLLQIALKSWAEDKIPASQSPNLNNGQLKNELDKHFKVLHKVKIIFPIFF